MRIFHPQTTLHGAERDNSFIVQDNAGVELGQGWLMVPSSRTPGAERLLQIRMHMDAHPAARDMLFGALTARGKFLCGQRGSGTACLVGECDPGDMDLRNYYAAAGFDDTDGEELFYWDLRTQHRAFYAPVGTTIVPTFLQTYQDMDALLLRINHWSGSGLPHEVEWLMEAAELPYFMVYGVYSGAECIGEAVATGADGEASLEMLYTLPAWRRHHVATALMLHLKETLAQRGAHSLRIQAQRSNRPAIGLLQKLKVRWMYTLRVYPTITL